MGDGVVEVCVKESGKKEEEEIIEVMDTPDRSKNAQIASSLSKFEESPVFNFLNSLSPIKPVKSLHISQTINPLSFASLPSVFTSPHVTSLKESRFLRRHQLQDPSKPEFSFDDRSTVNTSNLNIQNKSDEQLENLESRTSDGKVDCEPSGECSKLAAEFAENHNRDYIDSNSILGPECSLRASEYACNSSTVPFVDEASQRVIYGNPEGLSQVDQNKEATSCDWESLISDASDLLIFESPNGTEPYKKSIDRGTSFYTGIDGNMHNTHSSLVALESCGEQIEEKNEPENLSTQPGEGSEMIGNAENLETVVGSSMNHPSSISNYEHLTSFYRGIRRRCLVFEMGSARRKYLDENSASDPSAMLQSDGGNASSNDQQVIPVKTRNDSSRRVLPGIGLHLNALATAPKDYKIEASASGRLLIGPSSSVSFHPQATGQELLNSNSGVVSLERDIDNIENHVLPLEDANQSSGYMGHEELGQSSPKKKKRRLEQAGEPEACKRCNCKKSKCLKLYCECFAAGVYCVEPCACIDCFNKPIHEDTVLATRKQIESRNPLAFAPKVIRASETLSDIGDDPSKTPASARHKRGCNCKKSGCLKKYCECYQGGVGCSINCRCEGCKNAFGRKDGSGVVAMEEFEEEETDASEKNALEKSIAKEIEQNPDSVLPETPLRPGRYELSSIRQLSAQNSFSSKKKPPRSSFPSIGSSSASYSSQALGKPNFFQPPPKFDQQFETVGEDEIPEFLQLSSPVSGIKSSSPNRKRVSPPHGVGMSPGLRSSRKLILQSIPSFPSLTSNQ